MNRKRPRCTIAAIVVLANWLDRFWIGGRFRILTAPDVQIMALIACRHVPVQPPLGAHSVAAHAGA